MNKLLFKLYEYTFEIEYLNLLNSTSSGIIKIYNKNNYYISLFGSILIKENINKDSFLNLYINFGKSVNANKLNNEEVLISRAIDKAIRPLLTAYHHLSISINITILQMQPWIDLKFISIFTALALLRKIFNINIQVASINMNAKGNSYFSKYDRVSACKSDEHNHGYILLTGSDTHIHFLEVEAKRLNNVTPILHELKNISNEINNYFQEYFQNIKAKYQIKHIYKNLPINYIRDHKREFMQYRKFSIDTHWSNNSLILNRGDTSILSILNSKSGDFEFDHTYKSSGFATNELTNKSSRREVGHGDLVQKALFNAISMLPILKNNTTKMMSYVLNANGSTSMASVMANSLNLLKEGYLLSNQLLLGISFGALLHNNDKYTIITDMTANEDNISAMDFKIITNNQFNIYAIQMDCKIPILYEIVESVLEKAPKVFSHIYNDINNIITKQNLQHNIKTLISEQLSLFLKANSIIINSLKTILNHVFYDNKIYLHLQSTNINLNYITNFYLKKELQIDDIVIICLTQDINDSTHINNFHNCNFTRKQTLKAGDVIQCMIKANNKLTFIMKIEPNNKKIDKVEI